MTDGFNKSHSAAYADISFKTAYLKAHYPAEYMCAVMTVHYDEIDEIVDCIVECKKMGIIVLPPNINTSMPDFSIFTQPDNSKAILYGLTAIKGVGIPAAAEVFKYRPFSSFEEYMSKTHDPSIKRMKEDGITKLNNPLSKRNEVILIQAGCFDELEQNRYKTINQYFAIRKEKKYTPFNEKDYNRTLTLEFEKETMGIYISDHPLKNYPFVRWNEIYDGEEMEIGGVIRKIEVKIDRGGNEYATCTIETLEDKRRIMIQAKTYKKIKDKIKKDARVVISGYKNEEFNNIRVTNVRTAISKRTVSSNDDSPVEVDQSFFMN